MCIETIEVDNVGSARNAYEITEHLKGIPGIDGARCDFPPGHLTIDYDESELDREFVLDEIERVGCLPRERRSNTMLARLKRGVGL